MAYKSLQIAVTEFLQQKFNEVYKEVEGDEGYDLYKVKHNFVKRKIMGKWNPVDLGICLSHLYVTYPDTFKFEIKSPHADLKGHEYVASVSF